MRNLRALLAIAALALVVAACGDDDTTADTTATPAETISTTTSPTTTVATTTTVASAATETETTTAPSGDGVVFNVVTNGNKFSLDEIKIVAGQEVTIIIEDKDTGTDEAHNFHVRAGGLNFFTEIKDAPNTQTLTFTIDTPGVYEFFCDTHLLEMTGVFIVEDDM